MTTTNDRFAYLETIANMCAGWLVRGMRPHLYFCDRDTGKPCEPWVSEDCQSTIVVDGELKTVTGYDLRSDWLIGRSDDLDWSDDAMSYLSIKTGKPVDLDREIIADNLFGWLMEACEDLDADAEELDA